VDRAGWIRGNVDGFRVVLDPLAEQMRQRTPAANSSSLVMGVGSRVTGVQAGLILAYLSSRVLGQYELFLPPGSGSNGEEPVGRLTLVAPNIVMVERELGVDPSDFRRWVCLHEETHRVQFTSVPWLRAYVQDQMTEFLLASDLDPGAILSRLRAAADAVAGAVRGGDSESLIEAIQTPRQKEILGRLTALMTLVEGHGDYVMDAVGPQVVPSVAEIRERFNTRRRTAGRVEQAIRRLLGIDLKMRQYADGARFVRAVVDQIGMDGFNKVWESPETIPTMSEISNPSAWVARVAGAYAASPPAVAAPVSEPPSEAPTEPPPTAPVNGTSPASSVGPVTEPAPPADVPAGPGAPPAADIPQTGDAFHAEDDSAFGEPPEPAGTSSPAEPSPVGTPSPAGSPTGTSPVSGDDETAAGESLNTWYRAQQTDPEEAGGTGRAEETAPDEGDRRLWHDGQ
jgi:coenzyme F420 biosynthesis associated uncharacterized protein